MTRPENTLLSDAMRHLKAREKKWKYASIFMAILMAAVLTFRIIRGKPDEQAD